MPVVVVPMSRKIAMAAKVIAETDGCLTLSIRYNLSERSVQRYAHKLRNKCAMAEEGGRPRIFDNSSVEALRRFIAQVDKPAREEVVSQLYIEQKRSWCRLHHTSIDSLTEDFGPRKMSKRTIRRYLKLLHYQDDPMPLQEEQLQVFSLLVS